MLSGKLLHARQLPSMGACSEWCMTAQSNLQCVDVHQHPNADCRCIDKAGGLDQYLLQTSHEKLASDLGSQLKSRIIVERQLKQNAGQVAGASLTLDK